MSSKPSRQQVILVGKVAYVFALLILCIDCKVYDPLFCDGDKPCTDPERPFCDLNGEYPASEGIRKTCIPAPDDAGSGGAVADGGDSLPDASAQDASSESDASSVADASSPCAWTPLSRLANVNNSESEYIGSMDDDGLTIDFYRASTGSQAGFYTSVRANTNQPFGQPTRIEGLRRDGGEPEISSTRREIFYSYGTEGGYVIETASRSSPTGVFGQAVPTGIIGRSPSLSRDGLALYFTTSNGRVQVVRRAAIGGPWTAPMTVLDTGGPYFSVDISPDELRLLLTMNPFLGRPMPIVVSERTGLDEEFELPAPVNEEILVPGGTYYNYAKWDASQRQMVVTLANPEDANIDMYYSTCQ